MHIDTNVAITTSDDAVAVNQVIEAYIDQKRDNAANISPYYKDLWQEIAKLASSGSKRLRSKLVLLGYRAYGGEDTDAILPAAAAVELLHQGMLIHDDIIDRDYIRYGVDNIAGRYIKSYETLVKDEADRIHYAHSAALLAGDLMISESYLLLSEAKVSAEKILVLQRLLNQSIFEVVGGEFLDTESTFRASDAISPETIAIYKTASYSFTMPLLIGAQLADASHEEQVKLRLFGRNLGIAFQLRDDIIGIFGNQAETGKTTSGDIREGKRTLMIEQFYQLADEQQQQEFAQYFGQTEITDDDASKVRQLLRVTGALQATENAIDEYEASARTILSELNINPQFRKQMDEYVLLVTKRVK